MKLQKYKPSSDYSYALGATLVAELFETHPESITRVFLRPVTKHGENLEKILTKLSSKHIEIIESQKAFNILGAKDNCLLIAEFKKPQNALDSNAPHIVLVSPSDSGNLGTIIRTAIAFNYNNLVIITPAVDPYSPKTIRASMGAIFHMNIASYDSFDDYIKTNKHQLYAFLLDKNAKSLKQTSRTDNCYSLVFGNEAAGLPTDFATKYSATPVFIEQSAQVDSLNLSIAAAIAMYYFKD